MFNLAFISHFNAVDCSDSHHNVSNAPTMSPLLAQRPLLYVTDSQPITGSWPVMSQTLWMVTAKSSFMSTTRSYPAMAETVFTVKFELPALINLF